MPQASATTRGQRAGVAMRTGLLVIDMVNDFMDGVLGNPAAKKIVDPIAQLAARARQDDAWIVVYASNAHQLGDVELRLFPPHSMAGTPGAAVIDELRPTPDDVIVTKRFYSAFTQTDIQAALDSHDVQRLVLVGQHTDCCIRHTSYDAFVLGYELVVCPDATTVFEPGSDEPVSIRQARALEYLQTYYGAQLVDADGAGPHRMP